MRKNSENVIRTIRADPHKVEAVLENLDADAVARGEERERRAAERYRYRHKGFFIEMQQPGEVAPKRFLVKPRNLSEGGIAFLHGGFVHPTSSCKIRLISLHGSYDEVEGRVVGCRYVESGIHEVSVKFDSPIEPAQYCSEATRKRVLFVDNDPSVVRLAKAHFSKFNVELDLADSASVAIEKATADAYDLILIEVELPVMDGLTVTRELRKRGYSGRIVATTTRTQPSDRQACLDAGCDDYLPKPHTRNSLAQVLDTIRQDLIFSTLSRDPDMIDLVNTFVAELPVRIQTIEEATMHNDWSQLELHARTLKGEGAGYGFEILTQAAGEIELALINKLPLEVIRDQVNQLIKLCLQVRSSTHLAGLTRGPQGKAGEDAKPGNPPESDGPAQTASEGTSTSANS